MTSSDVDTVSICGEQAGGHCGYCGKTSNTKNSYGVVCDKMKPETYFTIMNRGWRRCGNYFYKPSNDKTCCPMYPIRCDVSSIKLFKSHRKVLKRFREYLLTGKMPKQKINNDVSDGGERLKISAKGDEMNAMKQLNSPKKIIENQSKKIDKSRKAKTKRYQLKIEKLRKRSETEKVDYEILLQQYEEAHKRRQRKNKSLSLSEYLDYSDMKGNKAKHSLDIRTVRSWPESKELQKTLNEEFKLYSKYQCIIHKDLPSELSESSFQRFLIKGGLVANNAKFDDRSEQLPLGQFHQQYWLDDNVLIAVGVIDIMPDCVSSVYLFYDPDYSALSIGIYSALSEIYFTNKLSAIYRLPNFRFYYMGFYIHDCIKMRYKAQYDPSFLSCPISHHWVPIDVGKRILDKSKFGRFSEQSEKDDDGLTDRTAKEIYPMINVVVNHKLYKLSNFVNRLSPEFLVEFIKFAQLAGLKGISAIKIKLS